MTQDERKETIAKLASFSLEVEDFTYFARKFGCNVILPGEITTRDLRLDGSRGFVTLNESKVTGIRFG